MEAKIRQISMKFSHIWSKDVEIEFRNCLNEELLALSGVNSGPQSSSTVCGHVFKKGEGNYRCRNCGLDDTCVLCSKCFHATDHTGHDVYFSVGSGGGGVCDCGDSEAWKVDMKCKFHSCSSETAPPDSNSLLPEVDPSLQSFVTYLIDYSLAVLIRLYIYQDAHETPIDITKVPADNSFTSIAAAIKDDFPQVENFCALLWNDEYHSFDQVIGMAMEALKISERESKEIADYVDVDGRKIVKISGNVEELCAIASKFRSIGLGCNVRPLNEVFEENLVMVIISFLFESTSSNRLVSKAVSKSLLGVVTSDIICSACPSTKFNAGDFDRISDLINRQNSRCNANSLISLFGPDLFYCCDLKQRSRLDFFLLLDLWLWKKPRNELKKVYVSTLTHEKSAKLATALRFFAVYDAMSNNFLTKDREHELSVLFFSVQLFTTPSVSKLLCSCTNIIELILKRLILICSNSAESRQDQQLDVISLKTRKYIHFFRDLEYLWSANPNYYGDLADSIRLYLEFISIFSEMDPVTRQHRVHVEYENESWTHAFNMTYAMSSNIIKFVHWMGVQVDQGELSSDQLLKMVINFINQQTKYKDLNFKMSNSITAMNPLGVVIVDYDISRKPISFHHPLFWLLGSLLRGMKPLKFACESLDRCIGQSDDTVKLHLLEIPLRTWSVLSQYRAGMWVRNGFSFINQAYNYSRMSLRGDTWDLDFALLQTLAASVGPQTFLMSALDRFGLSDVFKYPVQPIQSDHTQISLLVEDLVLLLLFILTDDNILTSASTEIVLERELIHALSAGPLSFSAIEKSIPVHFVDNPNLTTVLSKIATLKMPSKLDESGKYELNNESLGKASPFFIHLHSSKREEVKRYMKSRSCQSSCNLQAKLEFAKWFQDDVFRALIERIIMSKVKEGHESPSLATYLCIEAITAILHSGCSLDVFDEKWLGIFDSLKALAGSADLADIQSTIDSLLSRIRNADETEAGGKRESGNHENSSGESEKRSSEAKARKDRIMSDFLAKQSLFASQHADLFDEIESEAGEDEKMDVDYDYNHFLPTGTCIICQEELNSSSVESYGAAGCCQRSHFVRQPSFKSFIDSLKLVPESHTAPYCNKESCAEPGVHLSTCGHLLHFKCHQQYMKSTSQNRRSNINSSGTEFSCPLCKSFCNILIPVTFSSNAQSGESDAVQEATRASDWFNAVQSHQTNLATYLCERFGCESVEELDDIVYDSLWNDEWDDSTSNISSFYSNIVALNEEFGDLDENLLFRQDELLERRLISKYSTSNLSVQTVNEILDYISHERQHAEETQNSLMLTVSNPTISLSSTEKSVSICKMLDYHVRCLSYGLGSLEYGSHGASNEGGVIALLTNLLINEEVDDDLDTCKGYRMYQSLTSKSVSTGLHGGLRYSTFSYLLGFLASKRTRQFVEQEGSVEFFLLHSVTKGLLEIILPGKINSSEAYMDDIEGLFADKPVCKYLCEIAHSFYSTIDSSDDGIMFRKKVSLIIQIGEYNLQQFVNRHCSDFVNLVNLMARHAVPFLPMLWRSDSLDSFSHRIIDIMNAEGNVKVFADLTALFANSIQSYVQGEIKVWESVSRRYNTIEDLDKTSILDLVYSHCFNLDYHGPYRLLQLSNNYQEILESSLAFVCSRCNTNPINPAICLFCGQSLCASTYCCMVDGQGECYHHMKKCGMGVGMYLLVKKCSLLLMHESHGCVIPAPFMDVHGETDIGLRRGKPQSLNVERYKELEKIWITHAIPTLLARKKDVSGADGGWEMV